MSEQETRADTPVSDSTSQGIGARLAQAREGRGWSQDYVSERLKFSLRQLRALEAEDWSQLPQGVPLRGFVRNYARLLEIDVSAELHTLPSNHDPVSLNQASTLTTPLADARKSTREWPAGSRTRRRPATWLVGVLMLLLAIALIVVAVYRQGKLPGFGPAQDETVASTPTLTPLPAPLTPVAPPTPPTPTPAAEPVPVSPPAASPAAPVSSTAPTPAVALAATTDSTSPAGLSDQAEAPSTASAPPEVPAADPGLALVLKQDSWLEVRRGNGSVVISRVLKAGETFSLEPADAPYAVVIGNIQGVQLNWRGEAVDLSRFRGNVARLTLQ